MTECLRLGFYLMKGHCLSGHARRGYATMRDRCARQERMYCVCGCLNGVYTLQGDEWLNTGCLLCEVMTCFDMDWSDQKEFLVGKF
ncbi:hypothetical protein DD235_14815 [Corticimicrobacter populi]|uniref:Uncharacterized protein n=1 Tax=Corticimicrobacter populi TaxID=2175229 RepID=A0A2V1JUH0_9BURK|nr:hypothetical protein DD235_14815 [Corticimicrobacter populi]